MLDTDADRESFYFAKLKELSEPERLMRFNSLMGSLSQLMLAQIKSEKVGAPEREIFAEYARRRLGHSMSQEEIGRFLRACES